MIGMGRTAFVVGALLITGCGGGDADVGATVPAEATSTTDQAASTPGDQDEDDATGETSRPVDESTADGSPAGGGDDDASTPPAPAGEVDGSATVTIDGVVYDFATTGFVAEVCNPDQFGIFFGVMQRVDDSGAAMEGGLLEAVLVRDETAAAELGQDESMTVTTGGDLVWIADAVQVEERDQLDAGQSQVDSTEFTDATVSGTATFYSEETLFEVAGGLADTVTTAEGTFELTCVAG